MEHMDRQLSEMERVTGSGRQKAGIHGVIFFKLSTEYPCKQENVRENPFSLTLSCFFIHIIDTQYIVFLCCILT